MLDSKVADLNNVADGGFAGSVTAALFLAASWAQAKAWAHFDIFAWMPRTSRAAPWAGRPQARATGFALSEDRYGS